MHITCSLCAGLKGAINKTVIGLLNSMTIVYEMVVVQYGGLQYLRFMVFNFLGLQQFL